MKFRIISQKKQVLTREMKNAIMEAFEDEYQTWENEGQMNLGGKYILTLCEKIELGKEEEFVSVPIDYDSHDGGYLHVYGMRVKN